MRMSLIDWAIIVAAVIALRLFSLGTRSLMKGVADFLSANRLAGRYLLTIAQTMGGMGTISVVAMFEMYYEAGFPPIWWALMLIPTNAIILLIGWVYYRFRETRALTLAQFFEMRYNRRFRIFAGSLCFATGVLNFGIFPAVAARFFIHFCGLPDYFSIPGIPFEISMFATVMLIDLGLALTFVTMGGQISVMVTECVQGIFSSFVFVIVTATILIQVKWPQIVQALSTAPANASMVNPFNTSHVKDFNLGYFLIGLFASFYCYYSWQGSSGFNSSARTPHEQKMGGIIGLWRGIPQALMVVVLALAGFTILNHPDFIDKAVLAKQGLHQIGNETIEGQMRIPIALAYLLPVGVKGLLAAMMLFGSFACHDTYMHSWGSIFIQDVYLPIRNRALPPEQHVRLLRWSITGVAIFSFIFSLLYPQTGKLFMFMAITGTIWLGGSGAVIIGGLYWRRGTTAGAYCALSFGAILGLAGLMPNIYKQHYHHDFPVNGQWLWFIAMIGASLIYVIVSLLTSRKGEKFDLERMLSRGKHAVRSGEPPPQSVLRSRWQQLIGITKDFSAGDRVLAVVLAFWNAGWFCFFAVVTVVNLVHGIGDAWWFKFWHTYIWVYFILGIPITVWFTIGGVMDIKALFSSLATATRDASDDGRVISAPSAVPEKQALMVESKSVQDGNDLNLT